MRTKRGFTLIELLVVIAVIAILAAILFPVFLSAKKRAQMSACQSNMKQLASAMMLYSSDWNGYFVLSARGGLSGGTWGSESKFVFWGSAIRKYCADKKEVCYCPYAPPVFDAVGAGGMQWRYYWGTSIGMNIALGMEANNYRIWLSKVDAVQVPSKTIMLGDSSLYSKTYADQWRDWCAQNGVTPDRLGHWAITPGARTRYLGTRIDLCDSNTWHDDMFDPKRHNGLINIACVDGHVTSKTRQWLLEVHATDKRDPNYTWWDVPLTPDQMNKTGPLFN